MLSWRNAREVEPHDCPHQVKFIPRTAAEATSAGSASGNAIKAFLPPGSSVTFFMVSAALFKIALPVGTDPIRATLAPRGYVTSASPQSLPPQITLNTPAGKRGPMISASRSVDSG